MKKLKILSLLPSLLLCACGKADKWVGTYQFRLGKSDGNHMEITAKLTAEKDAKFENYKVMSLTADLGDNMNPTSALDDIEEVGEIIIPVLEDLGFEIADKFPELLEIAKKELTDFTDIKLYYNVTNVQSESKAYRLDIGTHEIRDRLEKIKSEHPNVADIVDDAMDFAKAVPFLDDELNLSPDTSKYLFNAFINKKGLKIQVPVSDADLDMQLIWYGFNYPLMGDHLLPDDYMNKMPGEKGDKRFGTHPKKEVKNNVVIKDELNEVNQAFQKEFSKTTLVATQQTDGVEKGRFAIENIDNKKHLKFIFAGEPEASLDGWTYKDGEWTNLKFENVPENGDLGEIVGTGSKAKIIGKDDAEYKINAFFSDPFEFRDFNVVDVGLGRVTE